MNITLTENEHAFDVTAAWRIVEQMIHKPTSVIGLSTGRTTFNMHRITGEIHSRYPFSTQSVTIFGLDEVTGVDRMYPGACYCMLKTDITDELGINKENFLMLPTESEDFERDCLEFGTALQKRGGIDLLMLGLGENGHLGFNQPGSPFDSSIRCTKMHPELEVRIRRETNSPDDKELGGVTLGIKEIMNARRIVLVAKGDNKTAIVSKMLEGPVTEDVPASILQLYPNCEFLLDGKAAAQLSPALLKPHC